MSAQSDKNSIIFHLVLSAKFSFESGNLIKIENQPFELQCIVTGTEAELKDLKSTWKRPDPNADHGEIPIVEEDGSANITEDKSEILHCFIKFPFLLCIMIKLIYIAVWRLTVSPVKSSICVC